MKSALMTYLEGKTLLVLRHFTMSSRKCGENKGINGQGHIRRTRFFVRLFYILTFLILMTSAGMGKVEETIGYWAPRQPPRANYKIDCTINVAKNITTQGKEVISFVNTTSRPIQTLAITWFKYGNQTLNIMANGIPVKLPMPLESYPQDFTLVEPVRPGELLTLQVEFGLSTPAPSEELNEIGPVTGWPQLWWGFDTHNDYQVKLDVPDIYTVATSGRLDHQTGYYHAEAVPSFGFFLGKGYEVLENQAQDVVVRCLYKSGDKKCAQLLQETAVDVIDFYRERFGFYPYRILTIIPGMDRPAGGYPAATSIIVIHGMGRMEEKPELHWRWITAHEIGHQYWSRHVMEKDDPGWLWIGLGIYADREYCRARDLGEQKHQELIARYIKGVRDGVDTTIGISPEEHSKIKFDFNNIVIHGKGFGVISALDCVLGESLFNRIYRQCLKEFAGRRLGLHEFRAVCEQESGQELGWFFDQWVNSNKYLSYKIASKKCKKKGDAYISEIEIRCLGNLKMPVPVEAYFEDGSTQRTFTNRLREADTIWFESRTPLKDVQLDPEKALPLIFPRPPMTAEQLTEAIQALPWVGAGKKALDIFEEARDRNLLDPGSWFKLGLTLYDGKYYKEALEAFKGAGAQEQDNPLRAFAAIVWQGHLLDLLGQRDKALKCYNEALKKSVKREMRHDQYGIRLNKEWVQKRLKEPFRRK
jgi:tetratricopeptide (TPR) repeat protein